MANPRVRSTILRCALLVGWLCAALGAQTAPARGPVHFLIPAAPGGGWDGTARALGQALGSAQLASNVSYENLSGGGGGRAIAQLIERGARAKHTLLVGSTPLVVRSLLQRLPQTYRDLTPIAAVAADYSTFAVRADSPFRDLASLVTAWKRDPRRATTGGGSVRGNMDHLVAAMVLGAAGGQPRSLIYLPYDGGGRAIAALLAGEVQVLSTGLGEVLELARSGRVRLLAVTAPARLPRLPRVPTVRESGIAMEFVNWRGTFGPPGLTPAERAAQVERLRALSQSPAWTQLRDRYAWEPMFVGGAAFDRYLGAQERSMRASLRQLGFVR